MEVATRGFTIVLRFTGTMPLETIPEVFLGKLYAKKKCTTYSFIVDNPNISGNFCCLLGRTNWQRITLTIFPYLGSQNTLGNKKYSIFRIFRPLQINHAIISARMVAMLPYFYQAHVGHMVLPK